MSEFAQLPFLSTPAVQRQISNSAKKKRKDKRPSLKKAIDDVDEGSQGWNESLQDYMENTQDSSFDLQDISVHKVSLDPVDSTASSDGPFDILTDDELWSDIDSDEEQQPTHDLDHIPFEAPFKPARKQHVPSQKKAGSKSHKANDAKEVVQYSEVVQALDNYLSWLHYETHQAQFSFPHLPKEVRAVMHRIVEKSGCRSESYGAANVRYMLVTRGSRSKKSRSSSKKVDDSKYYGMISSFNKNPKPKGAKNGNNEQGTSSNADSTKFGHGQVVGGKAEPIQSNNKGHQLLMKLGWAPGQTLGSSNNGIVDPIEAVVRLKGRGLGY